MKHAACQMGLGMETLCQELIHPPRASGGGKVRCTSENPIETLDVVRHPSRCLLVYAHTLCDSYSYLLAIHLNNRVVIVLVAISMIVHVMTVFVVVLRT